MPHRSAAPAADLAVVYLARYAEGIAPIRRFAASYNQHPAGAAHDLVIVRKGFPSGPTALNDCIDPLGATFIDIGDDGLDISAYAEAAARLTHRRVLFLNTFSEIAGDDWLRKLNEAVAAPSVGAAGASGSFESARTSMRRLKKGLFTAQWHFAPLLSPLRGPFQLLRKMLRNRLSRHLVNRLISRLVTLSGPESVDKPADAEFEKFWVAQTTAEGTYDYFQAIPEFPNPHLRTNGFIIERRLFLDLVPANIASKTDSYLFESGPDSMTALIYRRGLTVAVVGRDGTRFEIDRWAQSHTYRLGDQSNLLIHDNQSRAFEHMDAAGRAAFAAMAWGDAPAPASR